MDKDYSQKNLYVVLGMARSGTSVITRGLKALGVDLGEKLVKQDELWNPKGFWEDREIVYKINRSVLAAFNHEWLTVSLVDEHKDNKEINNLKSIAKKLLQERLAETQYWGFKDPRTTQLLAFWQGIFSALNVQENYIIALRNPLASAYSYQRVGGGEIEIGLLLWLVHLIPAIEGTHHKKRVMVSYDLMLKDPIFQLNRIKNKLAIPNLTSTDEWNKYQEEFLDKKLQHYEYNIDDLKSHHATAVVPICVKMYELFQKIATDEIPFESDEFKQRWQQIMLEFNSVFPAYKYISKLLKDNKQLNRTMRSMRRSFPWKLVWPLRMVDDAIRVLRRKARKKRRIAKSYA